MEDLRPLTTEETREWKTCRDEVVVVDLRIEIDWRQRSRQLWLSARDANSSGCPPNGQRETSTQQHPPSPDWRSGDQRLGSSRPGLCRALPSFLSPGAG